MNPIPTYGICTFVTDRNSPDEVSIHPKESPSEQIFIRRFIPYADQYARICMPHRHNFYQLMLLLSGTGSCTIDFVKFEIQPGIALFMAPGQVHNYNFIDKTDFYVINFSEGYFQSFLHDAHYYERFRFFLGNVNEGMVQLSEELLKKVTGLFDGMIAESHHNTAVSDDLIKVWMLEALMLIDTQCGIKGAKGSLRKSSSMISKFKKLVNENFVKLNLPKDYAALLFVTPSYLNLMTQRILGKTAGEVIRDRKLLEAKRLLVNLDLNISQIAYDLNFTDASHFSKFFKKHSGKSPEDFRKNAFEIAQ